MDFFAHQKRVQAVSRRLAVLFGLVTAVALATIYGSLTGLSNALVAAGGPGGFAWPPVAGAASAAAFLLVVGVAARAESRRLGAGGDGLAARLGARALDPADPLHRRLREVTEEVAVGGGVPVPALFVLEDAAINALAIGDRPAIAAVMVTHGALEQLDRAQLQGVVGHAVAHVLNGDATVNRRLASALYGLCSLRLAGRYLVGRACDTGVDSRRPALAPPLALLAGISGAALVVAGLPGVLAAHLLRAGIGRQREYLADAIAVRITGDRDGLGSVLRRIASEEAKRARALPRAAGESAGTGSAAGEGRRHSEYRARVVDFMMVRPLGFAWGAQAPLDARICQLYGRPMPPLRRAVTGTPETGTAGVATHGPAARGPSSLATRLISEDMQRWSETIAIPVGDRPAGVPLSATPAAALIARLRSSPVSHERAASWLCALVVGTAPDTIAAENDLPVAAALRWLLSPAGASMRVPVLELTLARLRRWSSAHRRLMLEHCRQALERHGRLDSADWVYYTLARHRLLATTSGAFGASGKRGRGHSARAASHRSRHSTALAALFAMAAAIGEASARTTRDTLAKTAAMLRIQPPAATPDDLDSTQLARALDTLVSLPILDKPILLRMLMLMARTPGDPNFEAFIRAVAAAIDCPMPRLARDAAAEGAAREEPAGSSESLRARSFRIAARRLGNRESATLELDGRRSAALRS